MMARAMLLSVGLAASCGFGCDSEPRVGAAPSKVRLTMCAATEAYAGQVEEALSSIQSILNGIAGPCESDKDSEGPCELVQVKFAPQKANPKSAGQRILIVDGGMTLPALTRYRSRVLEFLEFDEKGDLRSIEEEALVPRAAYEILVDTLDRRFSELPPCILEPIRESFEEKLGGTINAHNLADHGDIIFTKLAELNPNAQFVLVRDPKSSIDAEECSDWEAMMLKRSSLVYAEQQSLQGLIKRHGITHINFSFSPTFEHRFKSLIDSCPNLKITPEMVQRTIKDDLDLFFEPIFSLPGVISAQAIHIGANYESDWMRQASLVDCTPIPQRLRISAFGVSDSGLPVQGANAFDLFQNEAKASAPCVDLAINLGSTQFNLGPLNPPSVLFSWTGIETTPGFNVGSSWAAPLALSYLIYLQKLMPDTTIDELIRLATNDGQGRLKDPVLHKQFEIFRLGYLQ